MKKPYVKCPRKINKTCAAIGKGCDHAVKHKRNRWCDIVDKPCLSCVPYNKGKV